ncbi:MAG: neutral zinc metallopeptidase [Betaproteobacteria bacterium]|nr:neutral zinc metallopeptidase [Betaproteobacteria bacterium]
MRLDDERQSSNVEDMRGRSGGIGAGGLSLGAVVLALAGSLFFGIDPGVILGLLQGNPTVAQAPVSESGQPPQNPPTDPKGVLVSRVLASTEDAWTGIFSAAGSRYQPPKLVLFTGSFPTACGAGQAAAGPFYCPGDRKVYIDLRFYELMRDRFKVSGDFAQAYVIAHEVGHHVQNLLGITDQMDSRRGRVSPEAYNALSVRLELQADCFAGVWANHTEQSKHFLDPGDVDGALKAATAIGDDTLQQQTQGRVVPDSFTHGTSAQRVRWLRQGLETGDVKSCDTFKAREL